ncbi:Phosphoribosylamine--glycine ligase [Streptomyces alboniger]
MKVLVIGSGAREHALCHSLSLDPDVTALHCAPGNAGIAEVAELHRVDALDGAAVSALAAQLGADLVIVGPEAPLVAGVADAVSSAGIPVFGPSKEAAQLEGSKAFAKEIMAAAEVPTARSYVCTSPEEVDAALDAFGAPYVVKDDGLAAGKGVVVTSDVEAARAHANSCERVVIEEFLDGPEVSLFAITDGATVLPLRPPRTSSARSTATRARTPAASVRTPRCHGRTRSWSTRSWRPSSSPPSTRCGAAAPPSPACLRRSRDHLSRRPGDRVQRTLRRPRDPGRPGPPEDPAGRCPARRRDQQPRRPGAPALERGRGGHRGRGLAQLPGTPRTGDPITGLAEVAAEDAPHAYVLHAGTRQDGDAVLSAGGRVLSVTATGKDLSEARERAYRAVGRVRLDGPSTVRTSRRRRPPTRPPVRALVGRGAALWDDMLPLFPLQPPRTGRELLADHVTAMVCCAAIDNAGATPGLDWLDGPSLLVNGERTTDLTSRVLSLVEEGDPAPLRAWLVESGIRPEKPVRLT